MTIFMSTPGKMIWLQQSATVASTILGMCLMGIVHPPAGALVLVFLGAFNQGASLEKVSLSRWRVRSGNGDDIKLSP